MIIKTEQKMKELGYHGTCSKYQYSIETEGFDPDKSKYRDDHWLGQGIYFFDDYEKSLWWAKTTSSQNNNCGSIVFESLIEATDDIVLNLDDNHQLDAFMTEILHLLEDIQKECPEKMPIFEEKNFRTVCFDYYKQTKGISVIIGTFRKDIAGYTTKRNSRDKKTQKKIMNIIGIQFNERQICVSQKNCIKSTKLVYNEKEEVI